MSLLRDVMDNLFKSVRAFRGAVQTVQLGNGFWQGKQWRAYKEFNLSDGQSITLRLNATTPFILQGQSLYTETGAIRVVIRTGGTPSGTWADLPTVNSKYRVGIDPTSTLEITEGGALAGGTEREVLRSASDTGGPVNASGHGSHLIGWRGLPADVYYITITATGVSTGIYSIEWEEL